MTENTSSPTEVLHSENHAKLSAEQIAKAVARHKRDHSGAQSKDTAGVPPKAKKGTKS
jgi:hypothetical protein